MNKKKSDFDKVFSAWDILVIAFGAMIGWGWVVSTGGWIEKGGVVGAALGFAIGGVMIFFVGLTYAELTAAMPQCGGEHVFSHRAMGPVGSFVCTWAIILGYVGVTCFEACAFPTIITYLWPGFLKGYLYTVAGFDIYASWLIVAIVVAFLIMVINIMGAKTAAILQTILTVIIGGAGILLIIASVLNGTVDNLDGQIFAGTTGVSNVKAVLGVAVLSPFYFIGFDVIPQASEEINVPPKKIGKMLILSVILAVIFYSFVILAVGMVLDSGARGATTSFVENGQGDVLIAWENEAFLSVRDNPDDYEIVTPSISILAQPSVAVVDENVKKHDNEDAAQAYLKYLYSDEAQELIAENYYRPVKQKILKKHADTFNLKVKLTTIKDFGGWDEVQKKHFADGGVFDEIYEE